MNRLRWLVFAPVAFLAIFTSNVKAEPIQGLQAVGYSVDAIPPTRSDTAYPSCGSEIENNINRSFDGEPFQQCPDDYFMVHYTGAITIPAHDTIEFMIAADDGGTITIGETEFGTWDDKGCSWSEITTDAFPTGSQSLDGWFYENGGGTCFMLAWNIDNAGWEIVPDEAFTTEVVVPTTTTSTSTTTSTTTTTTTTVAPSTTTTSTTVEPTTTTDETTTTTTTIEPEETTTTSTSLQSVTPTTPGTTTTIASATSIAPSTTQSPTTTAAPVQTTLAQTTTTIAVPATSPQTTTPNTVVTTQSEASPAVVALLADIANIPQTEVAAAVATIVDAGISDQDATALAMNTEVLELITPETATQIFDAINLDTLNETEAQAIVEAVQDAPLEIRAAFEDEIDVFNGKTDLYVAIGSLVNIGVRRVLIVSVAFMVVAPPVTPTARKTSR